VGDTKRIRKVLKPLSGEGTLSLNEGGGGRGINFSKRSRLTVDVHAKVNKRWSGRKELEGVHAGIGKSALEGWGCAKLPSIYVGLHGDKHRRRSKPNTKC